GGMKSGQRGLGAAHESVMRSPSAKGQTKTRTRVLQPRTVKRGVIRLRQLRRAHVSANADDFDVLLRAAQKQHAPDWILTRKNLLRPGLADQHNFRPIGAIAFVNVAPGDERDTESAKIPRRNSAV